MRLLPLIAALLLAQAARATDVPAHTGFVTDQVGLLPAPLRDGLEAELRSYRDATTIEVGVLIVPTLGGRDLNEYAQTLWASWKIGKKGEDNGVLLLVVPPPEKKAWIATGYGIQPYLTDATCKHIVEEVMKPLNLEGKRPEAVVAGVHAIVSVLGKTPWAQRTPPPKAAAAANVDPLVVLFLLVICLILLILFVRWVIRNGGGSYNGSSSSYDYSDSSSSSSSSSSDFGGGDSGGGGGGGDSG